MISTLGFTICDWQKYYKNNDKNIYDILQKHIFYITKENNNDWIYIATYLQITNQIEKLLNKKKHNPMMLFPLFGIPFSVKDNINVAGWPTTSGCPSAYFIAKQDSFVVARLKSSGAIIIGKNNLDQYATGLTGMRSPYGYVKNTFNPDYISGGSSSGSAVVVAKGLVAFSLGTDTAGSGRIPASFNNIVGLKPTKGWLSNSGVMPACKLQDTVSVFALTVQDAFLIANIAGGYDAKDPYSIHISKTSPSNVNLCPNIAIPKQLEFFGDKESELAWEKSLKKLLIINAKIHTIDFTIFNKLSKQLYSSTWIAERAVSVGNMIYHPNKMHNIVHNIIKSGLRYSAIDAYKAEYLRADLSRKIHCVLKKFDMLVVPTTPTIYTIKEIEKEPIKYNSRLGIYTNFVNLANLCALSIPSLFRNDNLPYGITLVAPAWHDRALACFGVLWCQKNNLPLGSTKKANLNKTQTLPISSNHIRIAVLGLHITGMSLNYQLKDCNAVFVAETKTDKHYRLYVLKNETINKPGIIRNNDNGSSILVELWDIPLGMFGKFITNISTPFNISNLILNDGSIVKGFTIEESELNNALDITDFGGWRNWINYQEKS